MRERALIRVITARIGSLSEALTLAHISAPMIGLLGLLTYLLREPPLFPSLGATVYLFLSTPLAPAASPRSAITGHGVGIIVGDPSLALFGQLGLPDVIDGGMTPGRIGATALAIGLTDALLIVLRATRPAGPRA